MITEPFTDYRGSIWTPNLIAAYNRYDEQVTKREAGNPPRGSLAHKELEYRQSRMGRRQLRRESRMPGL